MILRQLVNSQNISVSIYWFLWNCSIHCSRTCDNRTGLTRHVSARTLVTHTWVRQQW